METQFYAWVHLLISFQMHIAKLVFDYWFFFCFILVCLPIRIGMEFVPLVIGVAFDWKSIRFSFIALLTVYARECVLSSPFLVTTIITTTTTTAQYNSTPWRLWFLRSFIFSAWNPLISKHTVMNTLNCSCCSEMISKCLIWLYAVRALLVRKLIFISRVLSRNADIWYIVIELTL